MDFDSPTLVYNEEEYGRTPPNQKAIFIYEWLRNLEDNITTAKKVRLRRKVYSFNSYGLFNKHMKNEAYNVERL